jgi:hypothetical protein
MKPEVSGLSPADIDESLSHYKTMDDLVKGHKEAQTLIRGTAFVPKADATQEQIQRFRDASGVPKELSGYRASQDATVEAEISSLRETAHRDGVSAKAWDSLISSIEKAKGDRPNAMKAMESQLDAIDPKLRAAAKQGLDRLFADDPALKAAVEEGAIKSKAVIDMMAKVSTKLGSDFIPVASNAGGSNDQAFSQTAKRIREIYSDPAFTNPIQSRGKVAELQEEVLRLTKALTDKGFSGAYDPKLPK